MRSVRPPAAHLARMQPYDPKCLPARAFLSANENPLDVEDKLRQEIARELKRVPLNRYPDPLANELRDQIARAYGLRREQVLVGNGGDELLFDVALCWGGPGRTFLNLPPTFSVYEANARLTHTKTENVPRRADFSIDEEAVLARVARGDVDYVVVTSPNNPTGNAAPAGFVRRLLDTTDALVLVDEAYGEFCDESVMPLLGDYENLLVLRTFSKAYALAGVRMGYVLGAPTVIEQLCKVRQPYSVNALSQTAACAVFRNRERFAPAIRGIVAERERVFGELAAMPQASPYRSDANFILVRVPDAHRVWERLYDQGVLVRDLSGNPLTSDCLRVSIGTRQENNLFLGALAEALGPSERKADR